jgi:hypothetical protein
VTPCMLKRSTLPLVKSSSLFYPINEKLALLSCEMKERFNKYYLKRYPLVRRSKIDLTTPTDAPYPF